MTDFSVLDFNKTYSYADYLTWKFQERIELIKGKVFRMGPTPRVRHQAISIHLSSHLYNFLTGKNCKVFNAPFDVRLSKRNALNEQVWTVVQPDVCVICDPSKLDELGCVGAPDIIVEILSPGNNTKELKTKYEVYEENGVREYWIIHPEEKTFLAYTLNEDGKYVPSALKTIGDEIITPILPGFILNLEGMFNY